MTVKDIVDASRSHEEDTNYWLDLYNTYREFCSQATPEEMKELEESGAGEIIMQILAYSGVNIWDILNKG